VRLFTTGSAPLAIWIKTMRDMIEKLNTDVAEKSAPMAPQRELGRIAFFHDEREFGFIKPDSGEEDVWFHASRVTGHGAFYKGRRVSFILSVEGQRRRAKEVWVE
jgi:cold shock CspA family protein